jgi:hypothetical protein
MCLVGLALAVVATPALAQSKVKTLGRYGDWAGYTYKENGHPVCYAASAPVKSTGKVAKREDTLFLVTHRPEYDDIGVVTAVAGYSFRKDAKASVKIGGLHFKFFTRDGTAWASGRDDKKVVKAMRKGRTMLVRGQTSRGVRTSDQYSLIGFTKAYKAISRACNVRVR